MTTDADLLTPERIEEANAGTLHATKIYPTLLAALREVQRLQRVRDWVDANCTGYPDCPLTGLHELLEGPTMSQFVTIRH